VRIGTLLGRVGRARLFSVITITALAACASRGSPGVSSLRGHGAVLEVQNDGFDDLVVYLIRGGTPIELGVAPGASRRVFALTPTQLGAGSVVLSAGKRSAQMEQITAPFDLAPGRIATWAIRFGGRTEQPVVK
jgi:hypothetical protein